MQTINYRYYNNQQHLPLLEKPSKLLNTIIETEANRNHSHSVGHAQKYGGVKLVDGISTIIFNHQTELNKLCKHLQM